jgi:SulP family sulfate permease
VGAGVVVAGVMVLGKQIKPSLPWSLFGLVIVSVPFALLDAPAATIGVLPSGLGVPELPQFSVSAVSTLFTSAATVAVLAAIESLLSARVAAQHSDTGLFDPDRELVGQGLASVASGFFGGMPATGAIARTAVNTSSGAKTRLAAIVHALALIVVVYTLSGVVSHIPLAALSGVLMVTAVRMVPLSTSKMFLRLSKQDALLFTLTALITVSVDLIYAVLIGVLAAAFFALRTLSKIAGVYRHELEGPPQPGDERIAYFRISGALFFAAADRLRERVQRIRDVSVVIVSMADVRILDSTGAQVLTELVESLERRGICVLLLGFKEDHLELAKKAGVLAALAKASNLFDDSDEAIAHARGLVA